MGTGADLLLRTLHAQGVSVCFANPGTTELEVVRALERLPSMRCVLGLQENVCTGAADGYGRMTEQPAATLLHLGPGLANGVANLHNARRARTPLINLVGDHTTWHRPFDAPLTSDIESIARPVSGWVQSLAHGTEVAATAREAYQRSLDGGGQGVTLIVPADVQAEELPDAAARQAGVEGPPGPISGPETERAAGGRPSATPKADRLRPARAVHAARLEAVATRLRAARQPVWLLGGGGPSSALGERGQRAAARLVARLGGRAFAETFPARAERGAGLPDVDRLPYFPEPARAVLDPAEVVVLAGALPPVTYFGYPGQPSRMVEDARLLTLCGPGEDAAAALEALADRLGAPSWESLAAQSPEPPPSAPALPTDTPLSPSHIASSLARQLPRDAIVSVEGGTCGYPFYAASARAARHTALTNTGGAIGQGLPVALGAAIACPGRRVVALLSDGSTQYTVQTLWSLAHERLPVTVLIAANHQYAILRNELRRGGAPLGEAAAAMTSLADPCIDWVGLALAYGVAALRAQTVGELDEGLRTAFEAPGPMLIEMAL